MCENTHDNLNLKNASPISNIVIIMPLKSYNKRMRKTALF